MNTAAYLAERDRIMGILIARRKELGMTQFQVSKSLSPGNAYHNVGYWEEGTVSPQLRNLIRLARVYGLRVTFEEWQ